MKLLLDNSATRMDNLPKGADEFIAGQLLTPLTGYTRWGDVFAVDNGSFVTYRAAKFRALLERERDAIDKCLWVAVPDVVGSARRTLEIWKYRYSMVPDIGWPLAYVCQDGAEDSSIPWDECAAVFIGGTTHWKMSAEAAAIIRAGKILGKQVHIGRINTPKRWRHFDELGADTCDGSGFARYDWMLERLVNRDDHPLFTTEQGSPDDPQQHPLDADAYHTEDGT